MGIELACERNIPYLSVFSSGRNIYFVQNSPIQLIWRNKCISWKNTLYARSMSALCIISIWELSRLLKGILPTYHHFQLGKTFPLYKIAPFSWIKETCVPLGTIPSVWEAGESRTLLTYENWISFWKECPLLVSIFTWEKHSLCAN
jgi:hypothetical protein